MEHIIALDIPVPFGAAADSIHPVVLLDDRERILVDCGYIGFLPQIEAALLAQNIAPASLSKVLITHHDHDHMGALRALKDKYPHIQVIASEADAPYVSGQRRSLRLAQAEAMQKDLPEEQKAFGQQFIDLLTQVEPVPVDEVVRDGQRLDWCGGCEVIGTPGHMPGHISLYLPKHKTTIAGDAMVLENGRPAIANPQFTLDMEAAQRSMERVLDLGARQIICYHGGVYVPG